MRNRLRLLMLFGGASLALGATVLVACSDDSSVQSNDGGVPEGSPVDGFVPPVDGGTDTGTDAPFDGGFQVETFDTLLGSEMCKALARCCYGNPNPADGGADGGTFDTAGCITNFGSLGFEGSNFGIADLKAGGNVVLDQVSADSCIKKIQALSCDVGGPEFDAVRAACYGAYSGKLAAGAKCKGSTECVSGNFCQGAREGDGGCAPLRATGAPCGDNANPNDGEDSCSYRRSGNNGNFCNFDPPDASDWTCTPARAAGGDCESSLWCAATVCGSDFKCVTPNRYLDGTCTQFVFP